MCSKKDIDRIDSGKYVVVMKWEHYVKLWTPIVAFLSFVVYATVWKITIEQKVFDDVKQKQEVLYFISRGRAFTDIEKAELVEHIGSEVGHMPYLDLTKNFIPRSELENLFSTLLQNQKEILKKQDKE
jgi:hypothetical protein